MDNKVAQSWADQMAEHGDNDFDDNLGSRHAELPAPQEIIDGDKKIVIAYKYDDDDRRVKMISHYRIEKRQVSKSIATRKNWKKFGNATSDPPGPNPANTVVSDDIFMQFISNRDDDQLDANREGTNSDVKAQIGNKSIVKCRYCEQDHWTSKCPYKDKFESREKEAAAAAAAAAASASESKMDDKKTGKYVPPGMREGGNKRGDVMMSSKSKDEPNTIRVTNLPEEILDSDIRELFAPFGRVNRIFLAKDKYTGQSKGFAFVSFDKREDAAKAIQAVNGYAPINPADINTIQGVYAVKPQLPAVAGNEGVAKIVKVGHKVKRLSVGDWVIPAKSEGAFGTWRTHCIGSEENFFPLIKGIDKFSAAQLSVNPCTAYRMLKDFVSLKPGDCVIQNGANSAVGINVIQLAREWGIKTINVIRSRPDLDTLKKELQQLGADYVVTEEELRLEIMNDIWKSGIPKPKLALNCVGGKNATDCLRHLDFRGTMVTYGGMSKQPVIIPTGSLIFKDQIFKGYWMSRWIKENWQSDERSTMMQYLCNALKDGKLKSAKAIPYKLDDYKQALEILRRPQIIYFWTILERIT
ncbi:trans-2-enoyl-CoA reductase-like protein [Leptotrombidium deliense]|uniref:Eukaryotic translation initiation factor 3 subunit G n=1 Tax=Leptotrombidium deliense TaxID=299467 RepID=A0A443SKI1_9ACAR|nr:trans-2-enoyl-CoA reductase-like protein [Leptotrombidium deliense]